MSASDGAVLIEESHLVQRIAAIGTLALGLAVAAPAWATHQSRAVGRALSD